MIRAIGAGVADYLVRAASAPLSPEFMRLALAGALVALAVLMIDGGAQY